MYKAIHIAGMHVPMYSLMVFFGIVAFFITYFVLVERKEGVERVSSNRLLFSSALGIVVLALSAFVFNSIFHSIEQGRIVVGGITWLGGVLGAFPVMVLLIHNFVPQAKGNALYFFSLLIPGIVIGHAFGRLGCFFGGCCYGGPTDSFLGVVFPEGSSAAKTYGYGVKVYPTQLFEAAFEFLLFTVMIIFRKKLKYYNVEIYLIAYGIFRFLMEFLRGDDRGGTGFFLTPSQLMCIILLITATLLILYRNRIIFKKLNDKCIVWQKEALAAIKNPPAKREDRAAVSLKTLKELHELKEQGILTEEEYEQKKKDILNRL